MKKRFQIFIILLLAGVQGLMAQVDKTSELYLTLEKMDSLIFTACFNHCDSTLLPVLIHDDFEFYHDQSGVETSKAHFIITFKRNLCSNWDFKPLRKLIDGSLEVFPLYNNGVLYGSIQHGEHQFYIKEPDKAPYLTSTAKFTHLWILEGTQWQLKRGLSYDHQTP